MVMKNEIKMKTIITLNDYPFEGCENANFMGSLFNLFKDFNIKKENVNLDFISSMKTKEEIEEMRDVILDTFNYSESSQDDGKIWALNWVLGESDEK